MTLETQAFELRLVRASQTAAGLLPKVMEGFDFTPGDWLERRNRNGNFHLGDLTLRIREVGGEAGSDYSTSAERNPVVPLPVSPPILAAADLGPSLPAEIPVGVRRY